MTWDKGDALRGTTRDSRATDNLSGVGLEGVEVVEVVEEVRSGERW